MTSENNNRLDDALAKTIGSEKRGPDFAKWQQEHPDAVQMLKSQAARRTQPLIPLDIGRIIMRSPITKLAVAAVIVAAVIAGIHYFAREGAQKCCAWERIADKVAQIKTCVYWTHSKLSGGLAPERETDSEIYISSDYGYRADTFFDGNIMQQAYMANDDNAMVVVMPSQKKYVRMVLNDEELAATKNMDPRAFVTQIAFGTLDGQKELGKDIINGVEVRGIEVNHPSAKENNCISFIGRMWVDVATEYPVRMEVEEEVGTGANKINIVRVFDGFEWGTELSPDLFKLDIPDDYTMEERKMPAQDEAGAIEGFKCFSEMTKGKYPKSIKTIMQEGMDFSTQSMQQSMLQFHIKDMNIVRGVPSSEAMQKEFYKAKKMSEAMQAVQLERMSSQRKLQGPINFYNKLTQDGKEPVYYGKDVNAGDANAVLMRWKVSDDTYRVIYGDLSAENVTPEKLKEMERAAQQ